MSGARRPGPSTALLLAQAIASESRDAVRDRASRREVLALWRTLPATARTFWLRKARRILERLHVLGPDAGRTGKTGP